MMFTIGGCYARVEPYPEIRVEYYAPKPGKDLWIDMTITDPPGGYKSYRDYWGFSGAVTGGGPVDSLKKYFDVSDLWYSIEDNWDFYNYGIGKGMVNFWSDEIVNAESKHPGYYSRLQVIAQDMHDHHPGYNLAVDDYSHYGGFPPSCYYQYYDLLIEAGNLTNILGKLVSTGCDHYWEYWPCSDVGGHWQYLRDHGGSLFNFAFIRNTDYYDADANFNNANNLGLNHLILYVDEGTWGDTPSFSNIA